MTKTMTKTALVSNIIRCIFLVTIVLCATFYFRFFTQRHHPRLSHNFTAEEYYGCAFSEVVKRDALFLVTKNRICVDREVCNRLGTFFTCKRMDKIGRGWKVLRDDEINHFDFLHLRMGEKGYVILQEEQGLSYRAMTQLSFVYWYNHAWIIDVNHNSYFWWPQKGNGRFFAIDKETFEYLGHDTYRDKNGIIEKNTRGNRA